MRGSFAKAEPVKGRIVFMSNQFELTEHVPGTGGIPFAVEKNGIKRWYDPGSNDGTCLYENGKVKVLYKSLYWPTWSPDGKRLATVTAGNQGKNLTLVELDKGSMTKVKVKNYIMDISWFPDGQRIAFVGHDEGAGYKTPKNVFAYDIKTGEETQMTSFENPKETMLGLDVSPDGRKIIFDQGRGPGQEGDWWLYLLDVETKEITQLVKYGHSPKWSPDGKKIVYSGNYFDPKIQQERSEILIYDFETQQMTPVTYSDAVKTEPCWSPDGKQILFVQWEGEGKSLQVINVDGTNQRTVVPAQNYPGNDISNPDWAS